MNDENKFASDHSDVESRVFAFRSCMEPALHLFPENIVERLKSDRLLYGPGQHQIPWSIRGRSVRAQSECDHLSGRTHKAE